MKYYHEPKINPEIAERGRRDTDAVNAYIDKLRGTIVSFEMVQYGQVQAYADKTEIWRVFAHQPNSYTNNAPMSRRLTREGVLALLRVITGQFAEGTFQLGQRSLTHLAPVSDPCGLDTHDGDLRCCWEAHFRTPSTD